VIARFVSGLRIAVSCLHVDFLFASNWRECTAHLVASCTANQHGHSSAHPPLSMMATWQDMHPSLINLSFHRKD